MTTLSAIDGNRGESLTMAVARRLRGQLAERRIPKLRLAAETGLGRTTILRRLSGETAINTDELELICSVTGISLVYLLTGKGENPGGGDGGDGGESVRHQGLEPRTRWFDVSADQTPPIESSDYFELDAA